VVSQQVGQELVVQVEVLVEQELVQQEQLEGQVEQELVEQELVEQEQLKGQVQEELVVPVRRGISLSLPSPA
jgi:hypothetical protein